MIYIILAVVAVVMLFGSVCACFKLGDRDGICQYTHKAEKGEEDCL